MKKLFIISGEKSGDLIANDIIQKAKEKFPNVEIKGVGGESFSQNNLQSVFDQKEIAIMGFTEILPKLRRILYLLKLTKEEIYAFKPEHIITVDSPGFNFQIAKKLQHARLSKREIKNIFTSYTVKKTKKDPIKIIKIAHKIYSTTTLYCNRLINKYKILTVIANSITTIAALLQRIFYLINNKYTKGFFKVFTKFLYFFTHSHIVQGVFLILFKEIIALIILLEALIIYFSTYKYLRYPWIVTKNIYAKIAHKKNAEKDLSTYYKTILLTKLEAKNTMYCNAINMVENLPKRLKFKFVLSGQKILKNLHKKFKKEAYSNAFSCKIHHIVAPSVWAYKKHRAKKVAKLYDTLFCILPFEPQYFTPFGLKTVFIGYPPYFRMQNVLKNLPRLRPQCSDGSTPRSVSLMPPASPESRSPSSGYELPHQNNLTQISITLGSRSSELKHHIPAIKKTVKILNEQFPQKLEFCIILLPHLESVISNAFKEFKNVKLIHEKEKWETVASSRFVIGKSGTNVMEFALLEVPSIVYYKANFITACIIKFLIYNRIGTLLNFTAGRFILPEFIQEDVRNIHTKAIEWIENDAELEKVKNEMQKELAKFASKENAGGIVVENLK